MARNAKTNGGGERPILPFTRPVRRAKVTAEIKAENKERAEAYLAWANSLDEGAKHDLADLIDLALEEVFRRDKGFQKHEASRRDGSAGTRADGARQSASESARPGASKASTSGEK